MSATIERPSNTAESPSLRDIAAQWRPETIAQYERIDITPTATFAGLLDQPVPVRGEGDPLPPLWHWLHLLDRPTKSEVGPDGHPLQGTFLPPIPDRRRMFAGGHLIQHAPFRVGQEVTRVSTVTNVAVKQGSTGEMMFVTVRDMFTAGGVLLAVEDKNIMYRCGDPARPPQNPSTAAPPPVDSVWQLPFQPDPVTLFRFSALTYNSHRIHYDQDYVARVEHYPDLIVHGPLLAILCLELPRRYAPELTLTQLAFRARNTAYCKHKILVHGSPRDTGSGVTAELAAATGDSSGAMTATAVFG
ncbi:MAG TPA: MaoC family dehydratase N-terminal domain-containing protein [Sporichthyaceae bacterium]